MSGRARGVAMVALVFALMLGRLVAMPAASTAQAPSTSRTPDALRRPADQTYLTYPEWFLVFSPEEYADWVRDRPPTDFPFLGHVAAVWAGYFDIASAVPADQPVNWAYHAMICVIASSTAAEYVIRSAYESTIGRLSAATVFTPQSDGHLSAEDRFAAQIAREYEQVLRVTAWYEFDYVDATRRLWTEVPFTWSSPVRALERRYALTTELVFKMGYAQVLSAASHATFDAASYVAITSAVVDGLPEDFALSSGEMEVVDRFDDGARLVILPRYDAFMPAALDVAAAGGTFREIAGNSGRILVSVRAPVGHEPDGRVLRRDPLGTQPGRERVLFDVPVTELARAVRGLHIVEAGARAHEGVELEHIFDY